MKKYFTIATLVAFLMLAAAGRAEMPGPDPDALWQYITRESPYIQWQFWPDHQGLQPGKAPHGPLHKVFVNDRALKSKRLPLQDGAIEVKENYSPDKALLNVTVMYKVKGYNPDGGDWFWARFSPQGKADRFGKPAACIGCHGIRDYNDYLLVHVFK